MIFFKILEDCLLGFFYALRRLIYFIIKLFNIIMLALYNVFYNRILLNLLVDLKLLFITSFF